MSWKISHLLARKLDGALIFGIAKLAGKSWKVVRDEVYRDTAAFLVEELSERLEDAETADIAEALLRAYFEDVKIVEKDDTIVFECRTEFPMLRFIHKYIEENPEFEKYVKPRWNVEKSSEVLEWDELDEMFRSIGGHPAVMLFNHMMEHLGRPYRMVIERVDRREKPFKVRVVVRSE
ncbi:hypothetical protein [Methanopyrus sp.]